MLATAYRKSPSRMYFSDRSAMSPHRWIFQLRRNVFLRYIHKYSEIVPTGQSQLQKLLRSSQHIAMKEMSRKRPAGWMPGSSPVNRKAFRFINEAIGSQPSTPGGRAGSGPPPAGSEKPAPP